MGNYIKSHSNYVLKKDHQLVGDGKIYERDITTIGATNQFAPGQTPIYRSGNFVITVRDDSRTTNQYNTQKWEQSISGDNWTLQSISGMVSSDEYQDDTKIILKNDYYDFREFAYYGSLTELFRSSINDLLDRFPGELYCVSGNPETMEGAVFYESSYTEDFEAIVSSFRLGGDSMYEVSNPYGIDIHSEKLPVGANPLKYFAEDGWKNYEIIDGNGNTTEITNWSVVNNGGCNIGTQIAKITIGGLGKIYAYIGEGGNIVYLHDDSINDKHIRPKKPIINQFLSGCNDLQRIMFNMDTNPMYKSTFSVIGEDDFGYTRSLEEFIYPTSAGGYNPSTDTYFINRLVKIGDFYDENLTDNLWRSMTHEAIKNFDWSFTREYDENAEEEHTDGGQKIQKAIRIFAREFDEQKKYIDNIKNTGRLTYDERGNIPDYFLTDVCEDDGWDVKSVIPYDLSGITDYSEAALFANSGGKHNYSQSSVSAVTPYSATTDLLKRGYFVSCDSSIETNTGDKCLDSWYSGTTKLKVLTDNDDVYTTMFRSNRVEYRIKSYSDDDKKYTYLDVNNEFLKRLKLNSRAIWRHKGTIEGIEMVLGLFGLKSSRWLDRNESCRYDDYSVNTCSAKCDYEITEYSQFTSAITDTWDDIHQMYHIDWINSTKTITYDNRSTSNYTLEGNMGYSYTPYQGIPVSYRYEYGADESTNPTRYLYPNFNKGEQLDGNPYFQMNGGWLAKTISNKYNFQFDVDNNIVYNVVKEPTTVGTFAVDNYKLYKETIRSIRKVENLSELLSLSQSELYDGIVCYVTNVSDKIAVIDGEVFNIELETVNGVQKEYVVLTKKEGFIKVGEHYFDESVVVYDENGDSSYYSLDDKLDGYEVKAYIKGTNGDDFICKSGESDEYSITSFSRIDESDIGSGYTNYFILNDVTFSNIMTNKQSIDGWRRLLNNEPEYLRINTISNYYKGNNGHNGKMSYDSGHEYFTYLSRIFKYATDNDLFDTRCYPGGFYEAYDESSKVGFSGLIDTNEEIKDYDKFLSADTKIHYFGNYKTRKEDNTIDKIWIYGGSNKYENGAWKKFYGESNPNPSGYSINNGITTKREIKPEWDSTDDVTNQIVNNKRLKIKFNMKYNFTSPEGQKELKYVDEIIMNYLTQMIPSTTILEVEYNFCDKFTTEC